MCVSIRTKSRIVVTKCFEFNSNFLSDKQHSIEKILSPNNSIAQHCLRTYRAHSYYSIQVVSTHTLNRISAYTNTVYTRTVYSTVYTSNLHTVQLLM